MKAKNISKLNKRIRAFKKLIKKVFDTAGNFQKAMESASKFNK